MGSISVDGPGQHNLDRSEDPWGNAGNRMHGGAPAHRVPRLRTRYRRWQRGARRAEANRTTRVELAVDGKAPSEIPEHAGLFEPADNRFARGFDHPGPHEKSLLTKFRITHPLFVLIEIVRFGLQDLR